MRIDRARTTALLAAAVLTAGAWVAAAPVASADRIDHVDSCIAQSKTFEAFKSCYQDAKDYDQAARDADKKRCEEDGGKYRGRDCEF
ncbi:hypothetical protein AB0M22_39825 [Nocardia sp. NPDC051756]|uniref:hypothetical protein n=1 Tax=Nocardia sp. NPDC051756 TaxID=3154751 RepID=UPI00342EC162